MGVGAEAAGGETDVEPVGWGEDVTDEGEAADAVPPVLAPAPASSGIAAASGLSEPLPHPEIKVKPPPTP